MHLFRKMSLKISKTIDFLRNGGKFVSVCESTMMSWPFGKKIFICNLPLIIWCVRGHYELLKICLTFTLYLWGKFSLPSQKRKPWQKVPTNFHGCKIKTAGSWKNVKWMDVFLLQASKSVTPFFWIPTFSGILKPKISI